MTESWVNLSCPTCNKGWTESPAELPAPDAAFRCPECNTSATLAEFLKTSRDLEIFKSLSD